MSETKSNIRVGVVHGPGGRIQPVWFDLDRRKHQIVEVTNSWRERQGRAELIYFHVTDEGALYELSYNLGSGCWALQEVESL